MSSTTSLTSVVSLDQQNSSPRLLLVANRLPVSIKRTEVGEYELSKGSGGLITGLTGLSKSTKFSWYGWPGIEIPDSEAGPLSDRLKDECGAIPVFLEEELADRYYNGFSNSILWPLILYHPGKITFSEEAWQAYQTVNRLFAKAVAKDVKKGDLIWIHDFHMMLLPQMLREELALREDLGPAMNVKIGFFLHTPFPSSEIYRILPVRNEILRGVLHCDLIGFHTNSELPTTTATVTFKGKVIHVGAFPIGIEPENFTETLEHAAVQERIAALKREFNGCKTMVGVDRLDYVKGIPQKLRAFELFLETHPEYVGSAVLIQIAVPTRREMEEYRNLRALVNELVGRINGRFGTIEYTPIHFMHKSVSFEELLALYYVADACVVASTRDGMNLVSFEYVACQQDSHGSLILSEFAGSAQNLSGAIIVNPWNIHDMARAMHQAMSMSKDERAQRFEQMYEYIQMYTSAFWGKCFVKELKKAGEPPLVREPRSGRIDWRSYDGERSILDD